ncbi:P-loop containing nucleoside triphosphate hydrolase protein [Pelagophyceae sp. CCMP2097]|nr:P-loop containing nucleoside triphosphate hydrolase protein [Pelagophyceae sp. CCMP2097]
MPTREEVVTALFAAAANAGTPLVVYVRDGGSSVLRSKGACRAVSAELARDDSRVLLVVSNYADEAAPAADEPADGDESTWAAGVDVDAAEAAAVERVRGTAGDAAPVADEPSLMFERILFDLARNVVSHARQAAEAADLDVNEARYLDSVGEALEDEGVVRAVAEKCARLLQDPSVKLHFKLTVAPQPAAPGAAASALRETLADQGEARKQRSDRARPDLGAKATASLLQWIGLGGDAGASSAGGDERSREAASLLAALDDVAVEVPKGTDARLDWERWAAEDAKGAAWAHNSAALTKALDKAGLSCDGWAQLEAPFGRDAARRLSAEEAAQVVLQAFKVELATAELATAELVTGGPFAGRVSVAALAAALRPGAVRPAGDAATLAAGKHEKALVQHVVQPSDVSVTFDSIGGLDQAKAALREAITFPLKYPELYAEGVAAGAVKGVLLFGPPGTGKTLLAKAVATEGGAAFLAVDASTIEDKWLGESEKNAKAVFALARRLAPCVIFIDEIDSLLASRESGDDTAHGTLTSVKTTLMQEWDGLRTSGERVVVIGSTNRPFDLDEAVLRRMPRRILVDLPDAATREAILGVALRGNRLAPDVNLTAVAQKLGGYSGSDVYEICREAAMRVAHAEANALEARAELSGDAGGGRVASSAGAGHRLRPLCQADLLAAVGKLSASVAEHGPEMARVLEWNDQYGEVKKKDRAKRPAASLYL